MNASEKVEFFPSETCSYNTTWGSWRYSTPILYVNANYPRMRMKLCSLAIENNVLVKPIHLDCDGPSNFLNVPYLVLCASIYHPLWSDWFCHVIVYVDDLVVRPKTLCFNSWKVDRVHLIENLDLVPKFFVLLEYSRRLPQMVIISDLWIYFSKFEEWD